MQKEDPGGAPSADAFILSSAPDESASGANLGTEEAVAVSAREGNNASDSVGSEDPTTIDGTSPKTEEIPDSPSRACKASTPAESTCPEPTRPPSLAEILAAVVCAEAARDDAALVSPEGHEAVDVMTVSEGQRACLVARVAVLDALAKEFCGGDGDGSSRQLVVFGGLVGGLAYAMRAGGTVFAVKDVAVASTLIPEVVHPAEDVELVSVPVVLDGWAWDSNLVLHGYNWQERSVWVMQLDLALSEDALQRHFRMIGTLASPGSTVLAVCVTPQLAARVHDASNSDWKGGVPKFTCEDPLIFSFAERCGFQITKVTTLRAAVEQYNIPAHIQRSLDSSSFADGYRFVALTHETRTLPQVSEVDVIGNVSALNTVPASDSVSFGEHSIPTAFEDYVAKNDRILHVELTLAHLPAELTHPSNHIVLIGSEAAFGCWDSARAKRMLGNTRAANATVVCDLSLSAQAPDVEYKYAVANESCEIVAWEEGSNRRLPKWTNTAGDGAGVQYIRDEWRS